MAKNISVKELLAILKSGAFEDLVGIIENEQIEFKAAPYQLDKNSAKMELAKDVSCLGNVLGGVIVIGVQTVSSPSLQGDEARKIRCFKRDLVASEQYYRVLADWMHPQVNGLVVEWLASKKDKSVGLIAIVVPEKARFERPYIVSKIVDETDRISGAYLGYFERNRANASPLNTLQLRNLLKDGTRFSDLETRLQNIEVRISEIAAATKVAQLQEQRVKVEAISERISAARSALGFTDKPTFCLSASPQMPIDFPSLFQSRTSDVVRLLENPPTLRQSGFDLSTRRESVIIKGELRRASVPAHKLLELWKDGVLIFVTAGDSWHLCWGMRSTDDTGLMINNIALTESTYLFCELVSKLYQFADPKPQKLTIELLLADMSVAKKPCTLNTIIPDAMGLWMDYDRQEAPSSSGKFKIDVDLTTESEVAAFELLSKVYAWFGFPQDSIPFTDRNVDCAATRIKPDLIGK